MAALKKRLLSSRTTRPVITAASSSIHPSIQHSLPTSGPIPYSPASLLPCHLTAFAMGPALSAPSVNPHLHLHLPLTSSLSLLLHPQLFVHLLPSCGTSVEAVEKPLSTFFFGPHYLHPSIFMFVYSPEPTCQYGHDDAQLLWQIRCSLVCKLPVVVSPGEFFPCQAVT